MAAFFMVVLFSKSYICARNIPNFWSDQPFSLTTRLETIKGYLIITLLDTTTK